MQTQGTLAVLPNLRASVRDDGRLILTEKFLSGMESYLDFWDGPVVVFIEPNSQPSDNLDNVAVERRGLPFGIDITPFDAPDMHTKLAACAVAQGGISYRQNHLAGLCSTIDVPFVYGTEYTLKTRLQIIGAEEGNPLVRAKRTVWEWNQERHNRNAIRQAAGIQCNGVPTFDAYSDLNKNSLLFFDTRVTEKLLIDADRLETRLARLRKGEQLRLAFSGRLNSMKGADHLIALAQILKARSVAFEFVICGGGPLEEDLRRAITHDGLRDLVDFRGVLRFEEELLPLIKKDVDLFVCCHRQGDPSCTYLETFACGVPIIGYDNEAFTGLLGHVDAGKAVAMDDLVALADLVQELATSREQIEQWSLAALHFAEQNTFESAFSARIEQLRVLAQHGADSRFGKSAV